jgi:hypothetical protein
MFETSLTVPTAQLREFTRRLTAAGFTILDTGERVATDAGPEAEATLRLVHLVMPELDLKCELGVSA